MTHEEIQQIVTGIVDDVLDVGHGVVLEPDKNLCDEYGADSLDAVIICVDIEKEFEFFFPEGAEERLHTISDITDEIEKILANR